MLAFKISKYVDLQIIALCEKKRMGMVYFSVMMISMIPVSDVRQFSMILLPDILDL